MSLLKKIDKWIIELYDKVKNNKINEVQLIKLIRDEEEKKSRLLFCFLVERILKIGLEKNKIIVSKALFKQYLNSSYKEHGSDLAHTGINTEELEYGFFLNKGIFIKILEKLGLNKTKKAYTKYLISHDGDFKEVLSEDELKEFSSLDNVIGILFNEMELLNSKNMIFEIKKS